VLVTGALINAARHVGYPALAALVGSEAMGIPLPGETALITAAVLASNHALAIGPVILVAAAAAIVGDNVGYLIGRFGGRRLLERPGRGYAHRVAALERGDRLFARHGGKAVFFGRWIPGLRVWAAWLAGGAQMSWPRFVFFNAAGGICWATSVGLLAFVGGRAAADAFAKLGLVGGVVILAGGLGAYGYARARRRRKLVASGDGG